MGHRAYRDPETKLSHKGTKETKKGKGFLTANHADHAKIERRRTGVESPGYFRLFRRDSCGAADGAGFPPWLVGLFLGRWPQAGMGAHRWRWGVGQG